MHFLPSPIVFIQENMFKLNPTKKKFSFCTFVSPRILIICSNLLESLMITMLLLMIWREIFRPYEQVHLTLLFLFHFYRGVNQTMKQLQSDPLQNTSQRKRRKLAPSHAHGLLATYQTQITRIVRERRKSAAIQSQTKRRERRRNTKRNRRKRSMFLIA